MTPFSRIRCLASSQRWRSSARPIVSIWSTNGCQCGRSRPSAEDHLVERHPRDAVVVQLRRGPVDGRVARASGMHRRLTRVEVSVRTLQSSVGRSVRRIGRARVRLPCDRTIGLPDARRSPQVEGERRLGVRPLRAAGCIGPGVWPNGTNRATRRLSASLALTGNVSYERPPGCDNVIGAAADRASAATCRRGRRPAARARGMVGCRHDGGCQAR